MSFAHLCNFRLFQERLGNEMEYIAIQMKNRRQWLLLHRIIFEKVEKIAFVVQADLKSGFCCFLGFEGNKKIKSRYILSIIKFKDRQNKTKLLSNANKVLILSLQILKSHIHHCWRLLVLNKAMQFSFPTFPNIPSAFESHWDRFSPFAFLRTLHSLLNLFCSSKTLHG